MQESSLEDALAITTPLKVKTHSKIETDAYQIGYFTAECTRSIEGTFESDRCFLEMVLAPSQPIFNRILSRSEPEWAQVGRVMFVPAGHRVQCRLSTGVRRTLSCVFSADAICRHAVRTWDWGELDLKRATNIESPYIQLAMSRLLDELLCPSPSTHFHVESTLVFLVSELYRYLLPSRNDIEAKGGRLTDLQLKLIRDRIENLQEDAPMLAELADLVGMSPQNLSLKFQRTTGRTLRSCLAEAKLNKAKCLLMEGRLIMKQIADRSGYASSSALSTAFRKELGMSPSDFLRQLQRA